MLDCLKIVRALRFGCGTAGIGLAVLGSIPVSAGEPILFSNPKAEIDSPAKAKEKEAVENQHFDRTRFSEFSLPNQRPEVPLQLPPLNPSQRPKDRKNWLMEDKNEQLNRLSGRGEDRASDREPDPWGGRDATVERVFGASSGEMSVRGERARLAAESSALGQSTGRKSSSSDGDDRRRPDGFRPNSSGDRNYPARQEGIGDRQHSRNGSFQGLPSLDREAPADPRWVDQRNNETRHPSASGLTPSSSVFDSNHSLGSPRPSVSAQDSTTVSGTRESSSAKPGGGDALARVPRFDPMAQALHLSSFDDLNKKITLPPPPAPSVLTNTGDQLRSWRSLNHPNFIEFPKPRF